MCNPIAFHAEMMGDIMCFHWALKQPDASNFVQAVLKEVNEHRQQTLGTLQTFQRPPKHRNCVMSMGNGAHVQLNHQ